MKYFVNCVCGEKLVVGVDQAGSTVTCSCGNTLEVPAVQKLSVLQQVDENSDCERPENSDSAGEVSGAETNRVSEVPFSWRGIIAASLFLIVLTCIFFREPVLGGKVFYVWDHTIAYIPTHVSNARLRAEGLIPLWNSHVFLGYPVSAEPESSGIYPPTLLFNLIRDPGAAYTCFTVFHHLLALGGMMLLARSIGVGIVGQTAAAMVFAFGGSFVAQSGSVSTTWAWTPLILGLQICALQRRSYGLAALSGVMLGIQVIGCQPQFVLFTVGLMLLCTLCFIRRGNQSSERILAAKLNGLILLVALGISAPQMFYFLEYLSHTERSRGLPYEELVAGSMPPHYFLQLLTPGLIGTDRDYANGAYFYEIRVYFGLLSLGLIALGWRAQSRFIGMFRIVLILGLVLALGRYIGIYKIFALFPVLRSLHAPTRSLMILSLGAAVLTGLGVDRLMRSQFDVDRIRTRFLRSYGVLTVVLLGLGALGWFGAKNRTILTHYESFISFGVENDPWLKSPPGRGPTRLAIFTRSAVQSAALSLACVACCLLMGPAKRRRRLGMATVVLLAFDLLISNGSVNRFRPGDYFSTVPPTVEFLRKDRSLWRMYRVTDLDWREEALEPNPKDLLFNTPVLYGLDTVMLNPGARLPSVEWYFPDLTERLLGLYNVKYLISRYEDPFPDFRKHERFRDGDWYIYEIPDWQPRVTFREYYAVVRDLEVAKHVIHSDQFSPSESVIVNEQPPTWIAGDSIEATSQTHSINVEFYGDQRVTINAELPRPGVLVLNDLYYPGWQATSNGRPVKILVANGIVRGLALGPGKHHIEFIYRPKGFYLGLYVTAGTFFLLVVWGTVPLVRRVRNRKSHGPSSL